MRSRGVLWGTIILLAGVLLMFQQLNMLPGGFWQYFGPLVMILFGVWFLIGPTFFRKDSIEVPISVPLDGAARARIKFRHGAGSLQVGALATGNELISGVCFGGVDLDVVRHTDPMKVRLKAPDDFFMGIPGMVEPRGLAWNVNLTKLIPLSLNLKTGASETNLNLVDLRVTLLEIETGASATRITLPAQAGYTKVDIKSGVASVEIQFPEGVSGQIHIKSGLTGISVDPDRFPKVSEGYRSPDFDSAVNKADIFIETGVGSVDIR
jgi:hypothetical protein